MKLFQSLTKGKEDFMLYENGLLNSDGTLTNEGRDLVINLLFQGKNITEIRSMIVAEIKRIKDDK